LTETSAQMITYKATACVRHRCYHIVFK